MAERRIRIRPRVVRGGKVSYPYLGDVDRAGLLLYHHSSRQTLPVPWQELIQAGADLYETTPEAFLAFLRRIIDDSGPSAPTDPGVPDDSCDGGRGARS